MCLIKLNATDSTNSYLRRLYAVGAIADFTTVITDKQTQGRGQMGAIWKSQASKNLTFSVFKDVVSLNLEHPFAISMVVSLALLKALQLLNIPKLAIKWPNDILSADMKICGILIENVIRQRHLSASIIGIGLNVNQVDFENLPKASSLKKITGNFYNLDELVLQIRVQLNVYFKRLAFGDYEALKAEYESFLFRKNKPSTFKNAEGLMFSGFIQGVSNTGMLKVLLEDAIIQDFNLKEITLLY